MYRKVALHHKHSAIFMAKRGAFDTTSSIIFIYLLQLSYLFAIDSLYSGEH
jgi:hypothetical protein